MFKIREDVHLKELLDNYENAIYGQASPITPSIHQLHLLLDYIANLEQQYRKQKEVIDKIYKKCQTKENKQMCVKLNDEWHALVSKEEILDILKEVVE